MQSRDRSLRSCSMAPRTGSLRTARRSYPNNWPCYLVHCISLGLEKCLIMGLCLQDESNGRCPVRVARHVGGYRCQTDSVAHGLKVEQPETDQSAPCIGTRKVCHQCSTKGADDAGYGGCHQPSYGRRRVSNIRGRAVFDQENIQFGMSSVTVPPMKRATI